MSEKKRVSRRKFLSKSAVGAAGLAVAGEVVARGAKAMGKAPAILSNRSPNDAIGLGIIGSGGRGRSVMRSAGFRDPNYSPPARFRAARRQQPEPPDLNLRFLGVCDIYEGNREKGLAAAGSEAKSYTQYEELLANKEIDAVIIATPDHWHTPIALAALAAGKDIYLEKCMTRTIKEARQVRAAVKANKRVFQLGHQGRQSEVNKKAREIVQQGTLGNITLIETFTNRNSPTGAWVYNIPEDAGPNNIDWKQWTGKGPKRAFSLERFFRWRCYWDYGTGLSGDLLTHELDAVNQIMDLGIPSTAVASGGIYYFKDGRDVPDVLQVVYEFPERNFTVKYNATQANSFSRGMLFMGSDATMELSQGLKVYADRGSERHREKIQKGELPVVRQKIVNPDGSEEKEQAVAGPGARRRGGNALLQSFTPERGQGNNTTALHVKEWTECIRSRGRCACNEDVGFEEAVTAHMATLSYRKGRKIRWDAQKEKAVVA